MQDKFGAPTSEPRSFHQDQWLVSDLVCIQQSNASSEPTRQKFKTGETVCADIVSDLVGISACLTVSFEEENTHKDPTPRRNASA